VDLLFLKRVVFRNLGARNAAIVTGPSEGLDNGVLSIGRGRILVVTSDPVSIIPSIGMKESAWMSIHHLASDFMTSGLKPQFAVFVFILPPELQSADLEAYLRSLGRECKRLGISIVAGHTGAYPGSRFTIVGGGVLFGLGRKGDYVTPAMARSGDDVLITKGAAIEATGVLARAFPQELRVRIGTYPWACAASYISRTSCVEDARVAAQVGLRGEGVTSMHDATEGGVLGGLNELSEACGKPIIIDTRKVFVSKESKAVCRVFGLDPLSTLSGGTLIITCRPKLTGELASRLARHGIKNDLIGSVGVGGKQGIWEAIGKSKPRALGPPAKDRYWEAYDRAVNAGMT
jgi:hydrogenase maturation factor